jgi:hypothetical protein
VFHLNVVKVDKDITYVAKCSRGMLQVFVRIISSVLDVCCKCLIKMFHLFHMYVASIFYFDVHMFHTYVVRV